MSSLASPIQHSQWKDFDSFEEIPFNEYYNDLKQFILTPEGKICEAMCILCVCNYKKMFNNLNQNEIIDLFDKLTEMYMQKSKYELANFDINNDFAKRDMNFLKSCITNQMWNLCIYSHCHIINTFILFPFLMKMYPAHDVRIIRSLKHTCVADLTTKRIYDLAMWNEILSGAKYDEIGFHDTILSYMIKTNHNNISETKSDHYELYTKTDLETNRYLIRWKWDGNDELYKLALDFCAKKYSLKKLNMSLSKKSPKKLNLQKKLDKKIHLHKKFLKHFNKYVIMSSFILVVMCLHFT